jgi:hypothetical protein
MAFLLQEVLVTPKRKRGRKSEEQKIREEAEHKLRWQRTKGIQ